LSPKGVVVLTGSKDEEKKTIRENLQADYRKARGVFFPRKEGGSVCSVPMKGMEHHWGVEITPRTGGGGKSFYGGGEKFLHMDPGKEKNTWEWKKIKRARRSSILTEGEKCINYNLTERLRG